MEESLRFGSPHLAHLEDRERLGRCVVASTGDVLVFERRQWRALKL